MPEFKFKDKTYVASELPTYYQHDACYYCDFLKFNGEPCDLQEQVHDCYENEIIWIEKK